MAKLFDPLKGADCKDCSDVEIVQSQLYLAIFQQHTVKLRRRSWCTKAFTRCLSTSHAAHSNDKDFAWIVLPIEFAIQSCASFFRHLSMESFNTTSVTSVTACLGFQLVVSSSMQVVGRFRQRRTSDFERLRAS